MIAFVLSGAGNRGPLQVGALRALLEAGLSPSFLVGTSAGAINASFVAAHGLSNESLAAIRDQWRSVSAETVYPGNIFTVAWRMVRGQNSLYANSGMRKLIQSGLGGGVTQFGHLKVPLYVASVDLISNRLFVFGEDAAAPVVDAVQASATVPAIHPPVEYHGVQLVDGGVLANVAASVAIDKGATDIYAVNAGAYGGGPQLPAKGVLDVLNATLTTMMAQTLLQDLARADADPTVNLHHIHIPLFRDMSFRDFSQTDAMIQAGYEATLAYLAAPRAHLVAPGTQPQAGLGETVPGAREYYPPYFQRI
jgi:NTE family protein